MYVGAKEESVLQVLLLLHFHILYCLSHNAMAVLQLKLVCMNLLRQGKKEKAFIFFHFIHLSVLFMYLSINTLLYLYVTC